ncbi:c-type cytochrome [Alkalimarinus alittae]|uniref:Cytochrome c n=1 Tax=Alkalimarinus alittae TaxID=2961619 RepID=A0ABY6N5Z6_9ALTE|nr:cytochrome c [Alkalimarinus alittae]UZE97516.1 cytochrome c [Alkalimarinus alittae]
MSNIAVNASNSMQMVAAAVMVFCMAITQHTIAGEAPNSTSKNSITQTRATELAHMVKHDCGSCHGMTLKGGLGPSLLPEQFKDKNVEYIKLSILHGRNGTAMPPWNAILSDNDAEWIAEYLLSGKINQSNQ